MVLFRISPAQALGPIVEHFQMLQTIAATH